MTKRRLEGLCILSKTRYLWWDYVRKVIRNYPRRCAEYNALHEVAVTKHVTSAKGEDGKLLDCYATSSGGNGRTVENISLRELPQQDQKEYDAVRLAFAFTQSIPDGEIRVRFFQLYYYSGLTLSSAAYRVHISPKTAERWNGSFVRLVAKNLGLL